MGKKSSPVYVKMMRTNEIYAFGSYLGREGPITKFLQWLLDQFLKMSQKKKKEGNLLGGVWFYRHAHALTSFNRHSPEIKILNTNLQIANFYFAFTVC